MFVTGIVTAIDTNSPRVKLQIPDRDNFETGWFFVPQMCTIGDSSHNQIKTKTLVAACCSDDLHDGCIIGALYNDEDVCILSGENVKYIFFEDGTKLKYDKLENELIVDVVGTTVFKCPKTRIESEDIEIKGDIKHTGKLERTGDTTLTGKLNVSDIISSAIDVIAKTISLFSHKHGYEHGGVSAGADDTTEPK